MDALHSRIKSAGQSSTLHFSTLILACNTESLQPKMTPTRSIQSSEAASTRSKRDSADLAGSVYLISGDGQILHLPIPSSSRHDPLNWSVTKRTMALVALMLFAVVALVQAQAAALLLHGLRRSFGSEVEVLSLSTLSSRLLFENRNLIGYGLIYDSPRAWKFSALRHSYRHQPSSWASVVSFGFLFPWP